MYDFIGGLCGDGGGAGGREAKFSIEMAYGSIAFAGSNETQFVGRLNCPTLSVGPPVLLAAYGWSVAFARLDSHPMFALGPDLSAYPMAYLDSVQIKMIEEAPSFRPSVYTKCMRARAR